MENINNVSLSGKVTDFSATVENGTKTGSFYLEWPLPITTGTQQAVDRIFCMVRDDAVNVAQFAVETGAQVFVQGRIRTRLLRHEGKGKKPVHAVYIAVKTAYCIADSPAPGAAVG